MKYSIDFMNLVNDCIRTNQYIGTGNPNNKILIIGKETANDKNNVANGDDDYVRFQNEGIQDFNNNAIKWKKNIENAINPESLPNWIGKVDSPLNSNPLYPFKSLKLIDLKEGHTWRKYQKIYDYIFPQNIISQKEREFNFHNDFFLSEMNNSPEKNSKDADKSGIPDRKRLFRDNKYFQDFPVIILACSDYIKNNDSIREIDDVFNVFYDGDKIGKYDLYSKGNWFFTHHSTDNSKLLIHTRQLSNNVDNKLLEDIADKIKEHLLKIKFE